MVEPSVDALDGAHCGHRGGLHPLDTPGLAGSAAGRVRPASGERGPAGSAGREWTARLASRTDSARPAMAGGAGRVRKVKAGVSSPSTTRRAAAV